MMDLDCDLFIFSDTFPRRAPWKTIERDFRRHKRPVLLVEESDSHIWFTSGEKAAVLIREDNNRVLERIRQELGEVHHFVGICDGCCEGGNYECVHDRPFLSRLLQLAAKGMKYTTDHSSALERRPYGWGGGVPNHPKFREHLMWGHFPEHPNRRSGKDEHELVSQDLVFSLTGVLVAPRRVNREALRAQELEIIRFDSRPTELRKLVPFRTIGHRGILAEYRVDNLRCDEDDALARSIQTSHTI